MRLPKPLISRSVWHVALGCAVMLSISAPALASSASAVDSDGDGYDDATELAYGYTPYGFGRLDEHDADADGLTDGDEIVFGADPLVKDTDGDGFDDGTEVKNGYDPVKRQAVKLRKKIAISLAKQELTYYLGPKALGKSPVSTGRPGHPTPVGTFAINSKIPRAWSNAAKLWMPWWMPFVGTTYGIHELPEWPGGKKEGEDHLGTPASGGCVRLGVGAAKTLYDWAEIGTQVVISKT